MTVFAAQLPCESTHSILLLLFVILKYVFSSSSFVLLSLLPRICCCSSVNVPCRSAGTGDNHPDTNRISTNDSLIVGTAHDTANGTNIADRTGTTKRNTTIADTANSTNTAVHRITTGTTCDDSTAHDDANAAAINHDTAID